jgi:MinD superfamily P-loop ATPase
MMTLTRTGVETMERAEFVARVDEARCIGCGLCDAACHFHAIASHAHGSERHAGIDPRKCFGCGLCRRACAADAIVLVPR